MEFASAPVGVRRYADEIANAPMLTNCYPSLGRIQLGHSNDH